MRSPFASAYLASRTTADARRLQAASAGFYERTGRPADPRVQAAGRRWQLDLSAHRSRRLDAHLLNWADLILVMDRSNLDSIRSAYPSAADKTYLLGLIDGIDDHDRVVEIPDPYTGSDETTLQVCDRIAGAIDRLMTCAAREEGDALHTVG